MRILERYKFQKDYAEKGLKPNCFFNPDNSVAVFEDSNDDLLVKNWVYEKASDLKKDASFFLNHESYQRILEFVKAGASSSEDAPAPIIINPLDYDEYAEKDSVNEKGCSEKKTKILSELKEKKLKVVELQEILIRILEL